MLSVLPGALRFCVARTTPWRLACRNAVLAGLALVASSIGSSIYGAEEPSEPKPKPAQKFVYVGVYVNQINSMSLKDEKVQVDFNVWFRWKADDLKPLETFDLTNGDVDAKEDIYQATSGGFHYAVCRCLATIQKQWDVRDFPLDNHELTIEIEDSDQEEFKLKYIPDNENCNLSADARVAGWDLTAGEAVVVSHQSNTNYGDIDLPSGHESNWSRFIYTVHMTRNGYGYFGKLFTGLFIAVGISMIGMLTSPAELDSKFALSVGAMFAAVASEYLVSASLPDSNMLTMADKLHIMSFLFIFLTLAQATVAHKIFMSGRETLAQWIDRLAFVVLLSAYFALVLAVVVWKQ
jgi:hypothetical protein